MKYEVLLKAYQSILNNPAVEISIITAKGLAITFIVFQLLRKYLKHKKGGDGGEKMAPYDFIRPLLYVMLIAFFTNVCNIMDQVLQPIEENMVQAYLDPDVVRITKEDLLEEEKIETPEEDATQETGILYVLREISKKVSLNPFDMFKHFFLKIFLIIDMFLYSFFLIIRFCMMFLLRFLGPFAIVASIFEKYKNYFWNWVKAYALNFFWIVMFWAINIFCVAMYTGIKAGIKAMVDVNQFTENSIDQVISGTFFMIVLVKILLYKRSKKMMNQIFTNVSGGDDE